jgi:hypothetical protein
MVKGAKVGTLVHACGGKIGLGEHRLWATTHLGSSWKTTVVNGIIIEASSITRRWLVKFDFKEHYVTVDMTANALTAGHFNLEVGGGEAAAAADAGPDSDLEDAVEAEIDEALEDARAADEEVDDDDDDDDGDGVVHLQDQKGTWSVDWKKTQEVREDARSAPRFKPEMVWAASEMGREAADYFFHFMPRAEIPVIAARSNTARVRDANAKKQASISEHEIVVCVGYLLAMTVDNVSCKRSIFRVEHDEDDRLFPAPAFGARFGMSKHRFEFVLRWMRFGDDDAKDKWGPIRGLVAAFNKAREEGFKPGWRMCLDESVSAWRGSNGEVRAGGMPHVVKIVRKPKGVGCELVDIADAESGVIMRLEIAEGKDAERAKEYAGDFGHGTAVTLRLTKPWHGSGRLVVADSAFASVKTAVRMRKVGMHFIGMVKTAHSKYPKKYFDAMKRELGVLERGDMRSLTATVDGEDIAAHCWFDNKPKQFVATCGTTIVGEPHSKKRWRNNEDGTSTSFTKDVKRQCVAADYFDAAAVIDIDNHYRQGGLSLEESWGTTRWDHRVAATIIGMCEVDAFLAYSRFEGEDAAKMTHGEFTETLALQLIRNKFPGHELYAEARQGVRASSAAYARTPAAAVREVAAATPEVLAGARHDLVSVRAWKSDSPSKPNGKASAAGGGKKSHTLTCVVCRSQACYVCVDCSNGGPVVPVCGTGSARGSECFCAHVIDIFRRSQ